MITQNIMLFPHASFPANFFSLTSRYSLSNFLQSISNFLQNISQIFFKLPQIFFQNISQIFFIVPLKVFLTYRNKEAVDDDRERQCWVTSIILTFCIRAVGTCERPVGFGEAQRQRSFNEGAINLGRTDNQVRRWRNYSYLRRPSKIARPPFGCFSIRGPRGPHQLLTTEFRWNLGEVFRKILERFKKIAEFPGKL